MKHTTFAADQLWRPSSSQPLQHGLRTNPWSNIQCIRHLLMRSRRPLWKRT